MTTVHPVGLSRQRVMPDADPGNVRQRAVRRLASGPDGNDRQDRRHREQPRTRGHQFTRLPECEACGVRNGTGDAWCTTIRQRPSWRTKRLVACANDV